MFGYLFSCYKFLLSMDEYCSDPLSLKVTIFRKRKRKFGIYVFIVWVHIMKLRERKWWFWKKRDQKGPPMSHLRPYENPSFLHKMKWIPISFFLLLLEKKKACWSCRWPTVIELCIDKMILILSIVSSSSFIIIHIHCYKRKSNIIQNIQPIGISRKLRHFHFL